MPIEINCFKAYDVRGQVPKDLNPDIAYRIGNATAQYLKAKTIVLGRDIRLSSGAIADAVSRGITDAGADVLDIGVGGTEMVYFATATLDADGGIMVTASHNPADYNGMKIVREEARPISADSGLMDIREIAREDDRLKAKTRGERRKRDITEDYIDCLLSFVNPESLAGLRIVVNAGNGGAGPVLDRVAAELPCEFIRVHHEPDGRFPNGVPNPMLEENRKSTIDAIREHEADMGVAWDGDFDRCFLFDENGRFIEGYYIVGLLAEAQLQNDPGAAIVYDPRLTWNTVEIVTSHGGRPVQSKSGHSFVKDVMRREDALYGGEMSAHHYFRRFFYADSGMIPWLLVAELVANSGKTLSQLVDEAMERYPASGEINRTVKSAADAIRAVRERYAGDAKSVDETDGVSVEFDDWRFNLRASNTEPVIRLNVESRGDKELMQAKVREILALLDRFA